MIRLDGEKRRRDQNSNEPPNVCLKSSKNYIELNNRKMADLDSTIINLKSCVISTKSGIPLNELESEYFKLNGERIPLKDLGCSTLEDLLNLSGKFLVFNDRGVKTVKAKSNEKTQHLTDLVERQKSKPPKKKQFGSNRLFQIHTSNTMKRPSSHSRSDSSIADTRNNSHQPYSGSNHNSSYRKPTSYNRPIQPNNYQPKFSHQNNFKPQPSSINYNNNIHINHENHQLNSEDCSPTIKGIRSMNVNGESSNRPEQNYARASNVESTNSFGPTNNVHQPLHHSIPKFQVNNTFPNKMDKISKSNLSVPYVKLSNAAQSRLNKYPKKCEEPLNKVNVEENPTPSEESRTADLKLVADHPPVEVLGDIDYINELESYLKNLNLSEPYYELMVKKEKFGKAIKLTHICSIKVNEKHVGSSFPVECNTEDYSKKVAAKHALIALKKQYGENIIHPITSDINTMASRIKEFLKLDLDKNGLVGEVLERMYREKHQENLSENWVQLLEVFSYFSVNKISNKIIIYLNETSNNHLKVNGHGDANGCLENQGEDQEVLPGTPLTLENYDEKSILVSANYGSNSVWIRLVGQNADENFIKMQLKFNDFMNTTGFSIAEQVTVGEFYAVFYNNSWHRVQVCDPTEEDGSVTCFMVDTGEQLNISKDQICSLEPVFMKTKLQAIECILTQMDNFAVFEGLKELLDEMILNKTFFLIPDSFEEGYTRVTLYEKGKGTNRINVNDLIIQRLVEKSIVRLPSFEENAVVDGNVSAIVESGHLYLQLKYDIVASLEEILPNEKCLLPEHFLNSKEDVNKDQVYLTKYNDCDEISWCRAQVLEIFNDIEVKIIFIDYGNHGKCKITELANLDLFDPLMSKIPPQAIKVSMNLIPPKVMNTEIANKIFATIGNDKVLVNLINAPSNDVPCIQLYKIQPDSPAETLCINVMFAQSLKKL